jgi:hypothetical protein
MAPLLKNAVEQKKFDVRLIEKNVTRGVISQEETEKYLKQLPDDAHNVDIVELDSIDSSSD